MLLMMANGVTCFFTCDLCWCVCVRFELNQATEMSQQFDHAFERFFMCDGGGAGCVFPEIPTEELK